MVQTKTSHLGKVSYAIILLGWRYDMEWGVNHLIKSATCEMCGESLKNIKVQQDDEYSIGYYLISFII